MNNKILLKILKFKKKNNKKTLINLNLLIYLPYQKLLIFFFLTNNSLLI